MAHDQSICILASMGWGVRNVLMSRAIEQIRSNNRLFVVSAFNHVPAFRDRFVDIFEGLEELDQSEFEAAILRLTRLNSVIFYKLSPSATHQHKVRTQVYSTRLRLLVHRVACMIASPATLRLSHRMLVRRFRRTRQFQQMKEFFEENGITTLISSNPLNSSEYPALLAGKELGLRTIAIITSWDNLSSKRPLVIDFDEYLTWNDIMTREVNQFYGDRGARVHQIGPLQFDYYFDDRWFDTRETFCEQHGLDPARKTVVYSGVTSGLLPDEPALIEKLLLAIRDGRVADAPNLLVRLHPKRTFDEFEQLSCDERWKGMHIAWNVAGESVRDANDRWCPLDDEIRLLTNTVRHGDVNLNVFSTMLLDFAVLDKPAVLIGHTGDDRELPYEGYTHLQPVHECNSHRIARNFEQTVEYLNCYLRDPQTDHEGRQKLIEIEGGRYLGAAWERLANVILNHQEVESESGDRVVG